MHALSKKLYYDVLKSGLEDTILESDIEIEDDDDEQGGTPVSTSEVGCSTRTHTKSTAVQTQWSHSGKNFRHEYTNTSDAMLLTRPISRMIAIHRSVSCEDIAEIRVRGVQTTRSAIPKLSDNKSVTIEFFGSQVVNNMSTSDRILYSPRVDECVNTEFKKNDKCEETCISEDYDFIPFNRGLVACHHFSLGTAEFRRSQKECCRTKLIGGYRVPVRKNKKTKL